MRRQVFDVLASSVGVIIVIVLLIAGGLLTWGAIFTHNNVHHQLAEQQIYFPPKSAFEHPDGKEITQSMIPSVSQYAGQQLLTGPQAKVYADDFIAVHLSHLPYGGVYSKISEQAQANPNDASLKALQQTSFQGTTLRGLLLQAYAFGTIGSILMWAAIASFAAAIVIAILVAFGFRHARRTASDAELMPQTAPTSD
jgi:hypothetical protein